MSFTERKVFFNQLKEHFINTGAVTPSSRYLARAIVSEFAKHGKPSWILEVGPGTGVFTREVARKMIPGDVFHVCEINPTFANHIKSHIQTEPVFENVREQIQVFVEPLQNLNASSHYDYIISGLPLNNFDLGLVKEILGYFESHLKNGGTLSYFEYIGIRRMKIQFLSGEKRKKLRELDRYLRDFVSKNQTHRQIIPFNIPPAYARHFNF